MTVEVLGTSFQNPVLLAAGTAGFGREITGVIDLDKLGGIVTKAVSPERREGNPAPRVAEFRGGMLNSIGLANPGVERVRNEHLAWLAAHVRRARVIVNVVGSIPADYVQVIEMLTGDDTVTAFELNVSCPNTEQGGQEFGAVPGVLADLVARCRRVSSRPLVVKLAPSLPDIAGTAAVAADAGADAISVVNTIPGTLLDPGSARTRLGAGRGGVSGPALLAVGVLATQRVVERTGLPVIGVGGIRTADDARQYLAAGASLVAIGTGALADPRLPERVARRLAA